MSALEMERRSLNKSMDQAMLHPYGAISGRRKLPWRYRWPDAVRDDVLARLLALNAERYAEEVRLGLHSKAAQGGETGGQQTAWQHTEARATSTCWLNFSRSNPPSLLMHTSALKNSSPTALAPRWIW
jgi:hypothetical protein